MIKFLKKIFLAPFWFCMGDTSWIGAVVGSEAQKSESSAARKASQVSEMWQTWRQAQQDAKQEARLAPWLKAGQGAVNQLAAGMAEGGRFATTPQFKFDQSQVDVTKDPGYALRMSQGQNALTAGSAAAGNYGSGNLGVALQNYGQDLGSQEYGAAYNRQYTSALDQYNAAVLSQNTIYNRLAGIAGTGQTAANTLGSTGQASVENMTNIMARGDAQRAQYGMNAATNIANMFQSANANMNNSASQFGNNLADYFTQQNSLMGGYGSSGFGFGSEGWGGSGGWSGNYDSGFGTGQGADSLGGGGGGYGPRL